MRLKLSLISGTETDDISVTVDSTATVAQMAERLRASHPRAVVPASPGHDLCIRVNPGRHGERTIPPAAVLGEAGIRSGDSITLTNAAPAGSARTQTAATLRVTSGPDTGKSFSLPLGTSLIGRERDCDIRLSDPMVSKRHARVTISDMVEVIDDNSANGILINDEPVQRAVVRAKDLVVLGDTELAFSVQAVAAGSPVAGGSSIQFNRSPRLDPRYQGVELVAPEPPAPPQPQRFPWLTIVGPLLMGSIMYAITKNVLSILFIGLSPIMMVGSFYENRRSSKSAMRQGAAAFREGLRDLAVRLQYACEEERISRRRENPSVSEVVEGAKNLSPLLWTRRPEHESFAQVRLGLGVRPSRNTVKTPETNKTTPELWNELQAVVGQFAVVDRVPVVADLRECGNIGIAGPSAASHPHAAAIISQFVGLHSPSELVLAALTSAGSATRWEWLKWLPHSGSEFSPLPCEHLASNPSQVSRITSELEDLVRERSAAETDKDVHPLPLILVLVEDDCANDRARVVQLAERGPAVGVHVVWVASSIERIPAPCRTFLELDPIQVDGRAGYVRTGEGVVPVEVEPIDTSATAQLASSLAPVEDAGALLDDQSDLPRNIAFLTLTGSEIADNPDDIIERWRGSNSLPQPDAPKLKRDNTLRALVGQGGSDRTYLDLRAQGPHALVGGTTGAGKSEFLQSWILGMASAHSPARVNFLFVDYKAGAAFADCVQLPHCVGLVTDLSPHMVRRALTSLKAELRRREHILNASNAKDLLELEKARDPNVPPSLVIVVDEFAALATEVPEFVDGVVDVAQRGRSLGLHLILATQRPAGVIKDNLRANTNLRIALRMADSEDSTDVVGSDIAGTFDPSIPGRGVAKTGPGRLTNFQSAYVGGHTTAEPPPPSIDVFEMKFGIGQPWDEPEIEGQRSRVVDPGPPDIERLVTNICSASEKAALPAARKPWLPVLSETYRLEDLPSPRNDEKLVFGVIDRPDDQDQPVIAFEPDEQGNMAVFGTGGSGKSTFLRSIAIAAGFSPARGGPCQVYGLDFGARGLAMIERLPHVGSIILGDDTERTLRLLKRLRAAIDERASRYADANAATIVEYRNSTGDNSEPRILLLVDNFGAFRSAHELGRPGNPFELLESIVAEGRSVGIHMVATADQANSFSASFRSVIQCELALRLTAEMDLITLNVPTDVFGERTVPGRGFYDGDDIQIAVLGGQSNVATQAVRTERLAAAMRKAGVPAAPEVERLADLIPARSIPRNPGDGPHLGVWDETLEPIDFDPRGVFMVAGPPRSGKTSTVAAMLAELRRTQPDFEAVLFGPRRSALVHAVAFERHIHDEEEAAMYAAELSADLKSSSPNTKRRVVVIESIGDFANGAADDALQALLRACRTEEQFAIVEGETASFNGNWGLMSAVKLDRTGIALQPDQADGDFLFSTEFPRVRRADFPEGRGVYTRAGRTYRIQVLAPDGA